MSAASGPRAPIARPTGANTGTAMASEVRPARILILVENLPVPFDRRVWMEATTLAEAGYEVSVICPQGAYPLPSLAGIAGHLIEYAIAFPATLALTWHVYRRSGFGVIQSAPTPSDSR